MLGEYRKKYGIDHIISHTMISLYIFTVVFSVTSGNLVVRNTYHQENTILRIESTLETKVQTVSG